ncbi:MAG: 3-oxoacyl-[acyl-carrier-protein] synthase II [Flammeovirgaceae bacterium]|jgi:3-oxoacyl-[acyl-carrier-protein] synthase II
MSERVVITGMGALTPIGNTAPDFWAGLKNGTSGARKVTHFDAEPFRTQIGCELKDFVASEKLDRASIKKSDLYTQYALVASDEAIADSGISSEQISPFDIGVIWGSGQGGMPTFEKQHKEYLESGKNPKYFNPYFMPKFLVNMASGVISMRNNFMGVNFTTVSACASATSAIIEAFNYIRWGKAKAIVAGGSDAPFIETSFGGFCALKAMSTQNDSPETASKPYDKNRDGFVMGEGAGALVLESYSHAKARGAKIYAEVVGGAMTADAYHLTASHPEGLGAERATVLALEEAGLTLADVDYINTHATSTPVGDVSEMKALEKILNGAKPNFHISATKSMTGHLLGATGAIEAIASIFSIQDNLIPQTINTEELDESIPLTETVVTKSNLEKEVNVAVSNTFGFGGHNAVVAFKKI